MTNGPINLSFANKPRISPFLKTLNQVFLPPYFEGRGITATPMPSILSFFTSPKASVLVDIPEMPVNLTESGVTAMTAFTIWPN